MLKKALIQLPKGTMVTRQRMGETGDDFTRRVLREVMEFQARHGDSVTVDFVEEVKQC